MPVTEQQIKMALERALNERFGLTIHSTDPRRAIARARHVLKSDPRFESLRLVSSPDEGQFWIIKKDLPDA